MLDQSARDALAAKKEIRKLDVALEELEREEHLDQLESLGFLGPDYDDFEVGRFEFLESIRLRWVEPNWFEFLPSADEPFTFVRPSGDPVVPRRMFTDGGSIPRIAWVKKGLSPWGYAPAYLVHDWEFDLHHCRRTDKSFEDVRDTMMEAIKTLMETRVVPKSKFTFGIVYAGINSGIAKKIWNRNPEKCPLPPDAE